MNRNDYSQLDKMVSQFVNTQVIPDPLARKLALHRSRYSYPKAFLLASNTQTAVRIHEGIWAKKVIFPQGVSSDIELDRYHHRLLHSDDPIDNLLGTSSVIYWGYQTFSEKYAENKVLWHINGYKRRPRSNPVTISNALTEIKRAEDPGDALIHLSNISGLGSIPFASKIISFMFPERSGIYDNQIANGLKHLAWARNLGFANKVGPVSLRQVRIAYTSWCQFLAHTARHLNEGIINGRLDWHWSDLEPQNNLWRAIDVERSFFTIFRG